MCLVTKQEKRVATKDLTVYKIVFQTEKKNVFKAIHYGFSYKLNKSYKTSMGKCYSQGHIIINEGFHAYTKRFPTYYTINPLKDGVRYIAKCTIPKGSSYYENRYSHEIVSDRIILKEIYPLEK